ncbi:MAG TPA: EAL domain-containing protein [Burkholderiales bacterium]|nr:EAL domain-containing protein [Burkholderiales bacterium]
MKARTQPVVLIIDDDIVMRMLAREALEQAGFTVEEASDGQEGLETFEALRPDAVLLDVMMPVLDGFETCASLRSRESGVTVPVLMMTGLDDAESIHRVYEVGATDFITKPIALAMLGHRVSYVLRASRAFQELQRSEARLTNAQRIAQIGHWDWNLATGAVQRSEEVRRILGYTAETQLPERGIFLDAVHPDDRRAVEDALYAAIHRNEPLNMGFRIVRPDGEVRAVHQQAEVVRDASGKPLGMQGTLQDVTDRKRAEAQIEQLALYDAVTGLPNRHLFREQLNHGIGRAQRTGENLVLLSLDLDRFKRINDTLGHETGDLLLKEAGARIAQAIRGSDVIARRESDAERWCIARQGGDEFTLLLPAMPDAQDAAKVARRLLEALAEPFRLAGSDIVVGASVGIAVYPLDGADGETLLKNADAARAYAKQQGMNRCEFYNGTMNARTLEKLSLESKLHQALERDEFSLHYQPKVDLATREVVGFEALIRWRHPELGMVSPADFIPLAEETGLITPIGAWVLRAACAQIATWRDAGVALVPVAINLSARQFHQENICEVVAGALATHHIPPHLLELEITESAAMKDAEAATATLRKLKAIGVQIAIDDFGTGYSSLSYLKRFPIDSLKIDRSFVTELPCNQDDATIAQAVITMGHALRLKIVAEGVETAAQRDFLAANRCDQMQGYFFSRPLPADQCTALFGPASTTPDPDELRTAAA